MANFTSTHTGAVIDAAVTKITATSSSATELNLLDGVTSTTAEINILDGVTSTAAEINILDGVTATTAEINLLDGVTATTTELNLIDGVTATTAEINYIDGVTSNIQTQLNLKAPLAGASLTGTTSFQNLSDGTITITAFADEDDFSSNSATLLATQQSIKAYVDANVNTELIQDLVGAMFTSNTESGITVAYQDGDGTIDLTVATQSDNNFTTTLKNKLDAIEASATADQSNAEIRTAVEAATDSNVFTDADHSKLNAIEASATADQTNAEIVAAVEAGSDSNTFTDADHSKLNAIEASADVTDTANVTSAGALMDSELTDLAGVKGVTISTLQPKPSEGAFANGDKTKLDAIEAGATADQTDEEIQDVVGAMFSSNTETGITATYQDGDGTIDLVVGTLNQDTTGNADTATKIASITNSNIVQLAETQTLTNKTLTSPVLNTGVSGSAILDEDNMASNSATKLSSQQSIKAYVDAEVAGVVDSSPAALNTLNELAAALGDDANFSTTTSTSLGNRLRVDTASQGLNGTQQANAITNLGITSTKAELNILDGVTSTPAELNILDGVTSTTAELNILDGVTATATEINLIDGVTATTAELNILDGVTSTAAELNILDGVTSTTAELNKLDGYTGGITELNYAKSLYDTGVTNTEFDYLDGVTSSIQTQLDATLDTAGTGIDISSTTVSVDVSDFMANGADNRVLTATGTDAMNAEANLTFDGTDLKLLGDDLEMRWGAGQDFKIYVSSDDAYLVNVREDKDIRFMVNDGNGTSGANITALKIDASAVGKVMLPNDLQELTFGVGGDGVLYSYQDDFWIQNVTQDQDIKFRVNDGGVHTDVMFMQGSTSRVGIGTTSPDKKLEVSGDIKISGGDYNGLFFENAAGTTNALFYQHTANAALIIKDIVNNADRVWFGYDGDVGIGQNPTAKLDVVGNIKSSGHLVLPYGEINDAGTDMNLVSTNALTLGTESGTALTLANASTVVAIANKMTLPASHSADKITMYSGGNEKIGTEANTLLFTADNYKFKDTAGHDNLFMNNSGNVGIGTASPGEKLTIKAGGDTSQEVIKVRNGSNTEILSLGIDGSGDGYLNFNSSPGVINTNAGDLKLDPAADVKIDGASLMIPATEKLYFDGGGNTHISEAGADYLDFTVGGALLFRMQEASDNFAAVPDNVLLGAGNSYDLRLFHNGSNSYIQNATGTMFFRQRNAGTMVFDDDNGVEHFNIDMNTDVVVNQGGGNIDFRVEGDTDTHLIFADAGTDRVGIGRTAPSYKLDINGDVRLTNSGDQQIRFERSGANAFSLEIDSSRAYWYNRTTSTALVAIDNAGNFGVGTASPGAKIHASHNGSAVIKAESTAGGYGAYSRLTTTTNSYSLVSLNGDFLIDEDGQATRFVIKDTTGNVGIGTTSPGEKLHVAGNIKIGDGNEIRIGDGNDLRFIHSSNSFMDNYTGHLYIRQHMSDHDIFFQVNDGGSTGQTVMCIDGSEQRVGIGTTSPGNKFTVNSTGTHQASIQYDASTRLQISVEDSGRARFYTDNNANVGIESGGLYVQPTKKFFLDGGNDTYLHEVSANHIAFNTGGAEKMRLTTGGLGVGMTPAEVLDLKTASGDCRIRLDAPNGSDTEIKFFNAGAAVWTIGHDDGTGNFVIGTTNVDAPIISVNSDGDVLPNGNGTQDLGSSSKRWGVVHSADLDLSNEGAENDVDGTWGSYVIQEGEDDLFLINRRSGKKYKFMLQEVA